ncbi:hypothetical protein ACFO3D_03905 [Virgibacillus kekensis]|uniref:Uncharacterized protein n=1 Tax=Virgibacillus kekensis TaxID=202261 RepID=A0ABV9DEW5_9BACI
MGILKEADENFYGVDRKEFAGSLAKLNDQLRLIEQKLTVFTDNEINRLYRIRRSELSHLRVRLENSRLNKEDGSSAQTKKLS